MKRFFLSVLLLCTAVFHLSAEESDWFTEKFPEKLITASGKEVETATALKGKIVAVYFTASFPAHPHSQACVGTTGSVPVPLP